MKTLINYLNNEIEQCNVQLNSVNELANSECMDFGRFLTTKAVDVFKAQQTKVFLVNLLLAAEDNVERGEFKAYLEKMLNVYINARVEGKPIHYNTNQMVNMCNLWEFENYTTIIKHIKNLIVRC